MEWGKISAAGVLIALPPLIFTFVADDVGVPRAFADRLIDQEASRPAIDRALANAPAPIPLAGQPDFAHFTIDMIADRLCVELKSLKMYFWSYRNEGAFHEKVTNTILDDIVKATAPRFIRITAKWYVRGGIYTNVVAEHRKKGWKPPARVELPAHAAQTGLQ